MTRHSFPGGIVVDPGRNPSQMPSQLSCRDRQVVIERAVAFFFAVAHVFFFSLHFVFKTLIPFEDLVCSFQRVFLNLLLSRCVLLLSLMWPFPKEGNSLLPGCLLLPCFYRPSCFLRYSRWPCWSSCFYIRWAPERSTMVLGFVLFFEMLNIFTHDISGLEISRTFN